VKREKKTEDKKMYLKSEVNIFIKTWREEKKRRTKQCNWNQRLINSCTKPEGSTTSLLKIWSWEQYGWLSIELEVNWYFVFKTC